jgi:hypothetical protein
MALFYITFVNPKTESRAVSLILPQKKVNLNKWGCNWYEKKAIDRSAVRCVGLRNQSGNLFTDRS